MATEAEIIPEPVSVLKAEEDISKSSLDLKKSEGGLDMPAGTYESSDKSKNIELATNNGVETLNTVSQGNPEISKGESFSVSPEVFKVSETSGKSDRSMVDDTPFKADKIVEPEDETIAKIEGITNNHSSPEEKLGSIEEVMSQNAEIESNEQEANLELKKQASVSNPDPIIDTSNEANETVTKAGHSSNIQEELEDKSIEEKKDTEPEKLPALVEKGEGTEVTDPIETSVSGKDQIISNSTGDTLTKNVAETSEIKDHETISEISEIAGKELQNENPYEEVSCMHEPAAEVGEKLEEVSKEPEIEEHPKVDISSSLISDETIKESIKEDESIPLKSIEKASSSTELEGSTRDIKEKTLVEGSTITAELDSEPVAQETEEKKQETYDVVPTEESSLAMTGQKESSVNVVDTDVEPADSSVSCEKEKEISREEDVPKETGPEDETLLKTADNTTLDVPKIESKETGPEHLPGESFAHTEHETGKCISVAETLKDEQSSDLGLVGEKIEDGKPLDEATDLGETSGICGDDEKVIQAEDDLAETEVPKGVPDQISEVINMDIHEEQSKETIPDQINSQADETITDVQNQESEQKINEEPEDKLEDEQKANEVTKTVILSKEVEDYTSVSNECLKEGDSNEQVETKNLEVEEHSTKNGEASLIVELEERRQDQESGDSESAHVGDGEPEEKIKDIIHESKESDETVTKVGAETSLDNTKMNEELVNLSSVETSQETSKSDANQEIKQVENPPQEVEKTEPTSEPKVNEAEETKVVPEASSGYPSESILTSTATLPSKDEEIETAHPSEKIGEEIHKIAEIVKHDSTIVEKQKESEPKAVSVETTIVDEGLQNEEPDDQIQTTSKVDLSDSKLAAEICLEKEVVEDGKKDEKGAARAIEVEEPKDQPSASALTEVDQETSVSQASLVVESREIETSALPLDKHEAIETEPRKDESPPKIQEAEICLEKEVVEDGKKDEIGVARAIEVEEPKDRPSASSLTEVDQETSVAQASLAVESREIETSALPLDKHEAIEKDESPPKIQEAEICFEKEEVEDSKKDETGAAPAIEVEEPKDQPSASALTEVDQETSVAQASLAMESREIETSALPLDKHEAIETEPRKDESPPKIQEVEICFDKEEVEDSKKDETSAARAIEVEEPKDQPSASALTEVDQETSVAQASLAVDSREIETSALPSEKHETIETEPRKDESPPKIQEQTTEIEEALNVEVETSEKAFDNELIKEKLVKKSAGENQCDNTNETIVNEVSNEKLLEVKEVAETSYLTSEVEELAKDGYGEDEIKDKLIKDRALKTTQIVEDVAEAQKIIENEIIEKQIVSEDKTDENLSQASPVTPTEEKSSLELSQAGQEVAKGSDNQIARKLESIANTEITSSIVKEHAPIDLQDNVAESSQKAEVEDVKEVYPKESDVGHGEDKIINNSDKKITEELTSVEDSTKIEELKDEHTVEKTNETLKIPAYGNEKDGANNNVEKEIITEDQTVKDQEQAQISVKETTIVPEEAMEKPEAIGLQPGEAKEIAHGEEKVDTSVTEINPEHAPASSGNLSLSDLLQRSAEEKMDVSEHVIQERELTVSKKDAHLEDAETIPAAKEPKLDDVPGGDEPNKNDSGSDAPVIVEAPKDTEIKPHKKSQNILSGVGSKVKNSISKVKKAITGKSSHSKESKALSSKGNDK